MDVSTAHIKMNIDQDIIRVKLRKLFPMFTTELMLEALLDKGTFQEIRKDSTLLNAGDTIKFIPLLISGAIRVTREDPNGHSVLLYYVSPGESCAMTVSCSMHQANSSVKAVAETDCEFLSIPIEYMESWMEEHKAWRHFVLNTYSNRFDQLLNAVDDIVFMKLEDRLKAYLIDKSDVQNNNTLIINHQDIASDLASSREVISRLLKSLEKQGVIKLGRNRIEVL